MNKKLSLKEKILKSIKWTINIFIGIISISSITTPNTGFLKSDMIKSNILKVIFYIAVIAGFNLICRLLSNFIKKTRQKIDTDMDISARNEKLDINNIDIFNEELKEGIS